MAIRKQSKTRVKPSTKKNTKAVSTSRLRNGRTVVITHNKEGEAGDVELIDLTVTANGTFYAPAGKAFKSVKVNVAEYVKPGITVTLDPSTELYDITVDTLNQLIVTANIKKNSNPITSAEIFINGTSVKKVTEGLGSGGIITYTKEYDPATNSNIEIKVTVFDSSNKSNSVTKNVRFVGKTYYGILAADVTAPTEEMVKALTSGLVGTKKFVYSGITTDYGKVCYAYPASFGSLTSAMDTINNFQYLPSLTETQVLIDNISYNVYFQTDPSAADNVQLSFS